MKKKTTSPVGKFYAKVAWAAFSNGWKGIHKGTNKRSWTVLTGEYAGQWTFEQKVDQIDRKIRISYSATIDNAVDFSSRRRDGSLNKGIAAALLIRHTLLKELKEKHSQLPAAGSDSMRVMLEQANVNFEEWATHDHALDSLDQAAKIWIKFSSHKDRVAYSKKFFACHSPYAALPSWVKRIAKWKKVVSGVIKLNSIRYMPKHWNQKYSLERQPFAWDVGPVDLPTMEQIEFATEGFVKSKTPWTLSRKILADGCTFEVWDWAETNRDNIEGALGRRIRHYLESENFSGLMRYHDELAAIQERLMYQLQDEMSKKRMLVADKWREECPWQNSEANFSFVVEVLRTTEEIRKEGDRQNHCVGTYAFVTNCYLLSLLHEDGVRTTAQVTPYGDVLQHKGACNERTTRRQELNLKRYLRKECGADSL